MKPLFSVQKPYLEERSGTFLRNIDVHLPGNNPSQPREQQSAYYHHVNFTLCLSSFLLNTCNKFFEVTLYTRCIVSVIFSNKYVLMSNLAIYLAGSHRLFRMQDPVRSRPVHAGLVAQKVTVTRVSVVISAASRACSPLCTVPDLRIVFEIVTLSLNKGRGSNDLYFM